MEESEPAPSRSEGSLSREKTRSSIKYSIGEGVASAASEGATEEYYLPYALAAGASTSVVGWLVALAQLALSLCYLKVPDYVRKIGSRKRSILVLVLVDVITFLPFAILPFLVKDYLVQTIFLLYILSVVPTIVVGPIWASWMTDLVPVGVRGRYLGQRLTFMGASELACFVAAGVILNWFSAQVFVGFSIIFSFAAIARLASWFMFWKMKDIPIARREEVSHFGFHDIVPAVRNGSVGSFMRFAASLYFAVFLAQPFFMVFMLSELNFSYLAFVIVICSEQVARLVVLRFWGRYADTKGSLRVVRLVCAAIPIIPVLWLVSQNIVYLIFVQIITGVAMAGFELGAANFMYGAAPAGSRIKYIALFRALNGIGSACGALLGGYLAVVLVPILGHKLLTLFLLSGLLRGVVIFKLLPSIIDVSMKRVTSPAWGTYRPKGMLASDAITDVFGWGLLYIPERMQRDLRRAFELPRQQFSEEKLTGGRDRLLQRWARLVAKHQEAKKPSAPGNVEEREELRRAGLRNLAASQAAEKKHSIKEPPSANGKGNWFGDGFWQSLKRRFGVEKSPSLDDPVPSGVALLHNIELGQKLVTAKIEHHRSVDVSGHSSRGELYQRWAQNALKRRVQAEKRSSVDVGKERTNIGLLYNQQAWRHRPGMLEVPKKNVVAGGQLRPKIKMNGLLYREDTGAWLESRVYRKNPDGRSGMVESFLHKEGLLYNKRAWGRYLKQPGGNGSGISYVESGGPVVLDSLASNGNAWGKSISCPRSLLAHSLSDKLLRL